MAEGEADAKAAQETAPDGERDEERGHRGRLGNARDVKNRGEGTQLARRPRFLS
jgi:hypothetical protein